MNATLESTNQSEIRCEYCQLPAEYTDAPFQVDHVIAEKHHGPTVEENLAWSCFYCNSFKGPNISGRDERTDGGDRAIVSSAQ